MFTAFVALEIDLMTRERTRINHLFTTFMALEIDLMTRVIDLMTRVNAIVTIDA